jgi:hypothetical protein
MDSWNLVGDGKFKYRIMASNWCSGTYFARHFRIINIKERVMSRVICPFKKGDRLVVVDISSNVGNSGGSRKDPDLLGKIITVSSVGSNIYIYGKFDDGRKVTGWHYKRFKTAEIEVGDIVKLVDNTTKLGITPYPSERSIGDIGKVIKLDQHYLVEWRLDGQSNYVDKYQVELHEKGVNNMTTNTVPSVIHHCFVINNDFTSFLKLGDYEINPEILEQHLWDNHGAGTYLVKQKNNERGRIFTISEVSTPSFEVTEGKKD